MKDICLINVAVKIFGVVLLVVPMSALYYLKPLYHELLHIDPGCWFISSLQRIAAGQYLCTTTVATICQIQGKGIFWFDF